MQAPEIREFPGRALAGIKRRMSFKNDLTSEMWREFRSREKAAKGSTDGEAYSVKIYDDGYSFSEFDPAAEFDKWAAMNGTFDDPQLQLLEIPPGTYAVFVHRGTPDGAPRTYGYILGSWLPSSEFELDQRPHFELLPEGYSPFDAEAVEEIWIPIRLKK